jgi:hypothetical protein
MKAAVFLIVLGMVLVFLPSDFADQELVLHFAAGDRRLAS